MNAMRELEVWLEILRSGGSKSGLAAWRESSRLELF